MGNWLACIKCGKEYGPQEIIYECGCGGLLEVRYEFPSLEWKKLFDSRGNRIRYDNLDLGLWKYRELLPVSEKNIVSRMEGATNLYLEKRLSEYGEVYLKHEGENPTGSFKDRGMTVGVSKAKELGVKVVACASTGNTSAALAAYASMAGMKCAVFIPEGKIALGKLAQSIAYGATVLQVNGNFDDAMKLVKESSKQLGMYLLNSVNPYRLEGQKTIMYETIQQLDWQVPDWVVVPGGNLGNVSAFWKGLLEFRQLGIIEKLPKMAVVQAEGASPFVKAIEKGSYAPEKNPETIATAIRIGNPVNYQRAVKAVKESKGTALSVSDQEIMDAKAEIDSFGIGCEPASAASVAGLKKLSESGKIRKGEKIVCVLTGHILKDPGAVIDYHSGKLEGITPNLHNRTIRIEPTIEAVKKALESDARKEK